MHGNIHGLNFYQRTSESGSIGSFETPTTYERGTGDETGDNDVVIRQPMAANDIEMTEGDLGLGDRTFNPRS